MNDDFNDFGFTAVTEDDQLMRSRLSFLIL